MLDLVDAVRGMLLRHPTLASLKYDDTGEPPMRDWTAGTLYVYEADDSDDHDLAGVGPQDRERFTIIAVVVAPKRGEGIILRPGRATSIWVDDRREAMLECVRRNRSRWGTVPGPPAGTPVGNPTPWSHLQGRGDVRFARLLETRLAAARISGWRILPNEEI